MRVLNRRQLASVPMVDAGHLYLGEVSDAVELRREKLRRKQFQEQQARRNAEVRARAARNRAENQVTANAQRHGAVLERSLRNTGRAAMMGAVHQGDGFIPQYGVKNPLLGFVDEVADADFEMQDVYPAQEFNNLLTARNNPAYLKLKDFPLVIDAPNATNSGFQGVLLTNENSADFAELIVNDSRRDFGYVPKHSPKRRRR